MATLHEAMVAVLRGRDGWMEREEAAAEIARRDLWARPSDGAAPEADQIRLRARRYPKLFELSEDGSSVRLLSDTQGQQPPEETSPPNPSRESHGEADVWALTENDIVDACQALLEESDYEILVTATTEQRGPDLIARSANEDTEIRIEAKGATSSKGNTKRFGKPFNSAQVLTHVSRAFYTAAAALPDGPDTSVRSAMALPDTPVHRSRVEPLGPALARLEIGVFWVTPSGGAELEASWSI
jgi:hypothetical protein